MTVISSIASMRGPTMAKKPSVLFSVLSWMFTPSSVMLIALCGMPFTLELRVVSGEETPGMNAMNCDASRLASGRFWI